LGDRDTLDGPGVVEALDAAVAGVVELGAAAPGDKTMVDALVPALATLRECVDEGLPLADALTRAADAAEEGARATVPMQARKGRASYLGERSIGHQDPGATSAAFPPPALRQAIEPEA
jgi:dihydroxyacetone kinase-like protein